MGKVTQIPREVIVKLIGCLKSPIKKHKQEQPDIDNDFTVIRCRLLV
jgi:hypothetical protein